MRLFFPKLITKTVLVSYLITAFIYGNAQANEKTLNITQASYKSDLYFDQLTLENGLNQGSIFAVTTDHRGFTWIGTQDGLHFFDGNTIQLIKLSDSAIPKYRFIRALKIINEQLLIATHDGLVLLNLNTGEKEYYTSSVGDIYQIETVENQIWLAGDTGIEILDKRLKTLFIIDSKKDICFNSLHAGDNCHGLTRAIVYQSKTNTVWLGTSVGLFSYNTIQKTLSTHAPTNNNYLDKSLDIRSLVFDQNDTLWIGSDCGLYKKNHNYKTLTIVDSCKKPTNLLSSTNIRALAIDTNNNIWVGSAKGLSWFNLIDQNITSHKIMPHAANKHGLTNEFIRTIHTDDKGRIWLGTNNGLSVTNIERLNIGIYRAPVDSPVIGNYTYSFISVKNDNKLYISNGKGLNLVNLKNMNQVTPIISNETIFDTEKVADFVWAGGRGYLYQIEDKTYKKINTFDANNSPLDGRYIYKLLGDNIGNLWVGTSYGLYRYNITTNVWTYWNKHNGLVDGEIYELKWINKKLWIGTQNGISVFDIQKQTFTNFDNKNSNLTSKWIFDIDQINNTVYVATDGGVYEFINNTFEYLPIINGNAYSVLPFANNMLIVTTNTGLKVYNTENKTTLTLTAADGLASDEFNYNAHYIYKNNVFLGSPTGYSVMSADYLNHQFEHHITNQKLTDTHYITQALIDGEKYGMWSILPISDDNLLSTNHLSIDWLNTQISLQLSNPYFATTSHLKYLSSYILLKNHQNSYHLSPKELNLDTLSSGKYSLDLHHNEPVTIIKTAHPLIRTWAITLYILVFVFVIWFFFRFYYLTKFTNKLKIKNSLIEQQHETIEKHLQFKEHIFFQVQHSLKSPISASRGLLYLLEKQLNNNNFDKITLLRKTNKLKNAQNKLTELIEQILIISSSDHTALIKTIQNIKDVLYKVLPMMEELAFQKNIQLNVDCKTLTAEARVSTIDMGVFIIFENIISNAIKYSPENSLITIKVEQFNNHLFITVIDNGIGICNDEHEKILQMFYRGKNSSNTHGNGLGLALVKQIVDDISGEIRIESSLNKGTVINIKFTLLKHNKEV